MEFERVEPRLKRASGFRAAFTAPGPLLTISTYLPSPKFPGFPNQHFMPPPVKLAIIGGGPSAFYVASRLLSLLPLGDPVSPPMRVHIYDRLWAPHGLVRYGVAPDHPEVKVGFSIFMLK